MSKTFFDGTTKRTYDTVALTRYSGGLQLSVSTYLHSWRCPPNLREEPPLPGSAWAQLSKEEVVILRDQLNRFLNGIGDCDDEENFTTSVPLYEVWARYIGDGDGRLFRGSRLDCEAFMLRFSRYRSWSWRADSTCDYGGYWYDTHFGSTYEIRPIKV